MNAGELQNLLNTGVVEIRFSRRRPVKDKAPTRRMFATSCLPLLESVNGRLTLNFKPTTGNPKYNPASKGLLMVWDVIMQGYRMVDPAQTNLLNFIPQEDFWEFFNANIYPMSGDEKVNFMNS